MKPISLPLLLHWAEMEKIMKIVLQY
jgi:hypothetical protein